MTDSRPLGLLVDYGGVLTTDVFASFATFSTGLGLPADHVKLLFRNDPTARQLLHDLEVGALSEAEFERGFGALLDVPPEKLIDRLLGGRDDPVMIGAVRAARAAGVRTGLISNSWGADRYDRALLAELFDGVVISGEVGMRKPDPRIYALGAEAVGLQPAQCVYIDDIGGNLKPPRALGMTTLLHADADETVGRLEEIFDLQLRVH